MLRRDGDFSDVTITTNEQGIEIPKVPGKMYCKLYLTWTVPNSLRGKELTISWSVHKTGNMTEWSEDVSIKSTEVTFPVIPELVKPELVEPMIGYDAAHAGQMMLIYTMGTNNINSITAHYNELSGQRSTHKTIPVDPKMSGYIYLDADKCYKDFYLEADYQDMENRRRVARSDSMTLPVLHMPANFTATLQDDGTAKISWTTTHTKWNDIISDDSWNLQRNTSGALNANAKWESITEIPFESGDSVYTFIDNSLLNNYEGKPVYYRLRRSSTSQVSAGPTGWR